MGLLICQHCGTVLRQRVKMCRDCGSIMSRHSPTVIPVLKAQRMTPNSPQALKPENDPLLVERVVTRCKFNEAMTPKPRRFHGSRSFFNEGSSGSDKEVAPEKNFLYEEAPAKQATVKVEEIQPVTATIANEASDKKQDEPLTATPEKVNNEGPSQTQDFFDSQDPKKEKPVPAPATSDSSPSKSKESFVTKAPLPSFMVADWFLLVVQENDGETLSLTQSVEGKENEPVFGTLPAPNHFNLCSSLEAPATTVVMSANSMFGSFLDATRDENFAEREADHALNVDSRLAFEEGLSRISALRLQGALRKSGVLGFEGPQDDDFKMKFTRKPHLSSADGDTSSDTTVKEESAPAVKPEETGVRKRRSTKNEVKVEETPAPPKKKNPAAIAGAVVGILLVVAFIGIFAYLKVSSLQSGSDTVSGASSPDGRFPRNWHIVLYTTNQGYKAIVQDFKVDVNQSDETLSGKGTDEVGAYEITGKLTGTNLSLQKEYGGDVWPINFSGRVLDGAGPSFASGDFFWHRPDQGKLQGTWEATR